MSDFSDFVILEDDYPEPEYLSNFPEKITFQVEDGYIWIMSVQAQDGSDSQGTTSCEQDHGCLDYIIERRMIDPPRDGYYVMENATVTYYRGDGWTTDDDAELDGDPIRPARFYEIREHEPLKTSLLSLWTQLKLQWLFVQGYEL